MASELAERNHVHLSEHGGSGQGVVGALAAVGLRLAGQDGRVKGKKTVQGEVMAVRELLEQTGFDRVCAYGVGELAENVHVKKKYLTPLSLSCMITQVMLWRAL